MRRTWCACCARAPRADRLLLIVTFVLTVFVDLVVAVNVGVVLAALLFMRRMAETVQRRSSRYSTDPRRRTKKSVLPHNVLVYRIDGPFFFGAAEKLERTLERAAARRRDHRDPPRPRAVHGRDRPATP